VTASDRSGPVTVHHNQFPTAQPQACRLRQRFQQVPLGWWPFGGHVVVAEHGDDGFRSPFQVGKNACTSDIASVDNALAAGNDTPDTIIEITMGVGDDRDPAGLRTVVFHLATPVPETPPTGRYLRKDTLLSPGYRET
jgi:hypothetical protein